MPQFHLTIANIFICYSILEDRWFGWLDALFGHTRPPNIYVDFPFCQSSQDLCFSVMIIIIFLLFSKVWTNIIVFLQILSFWNVRSHHDCSIIVFKDDVGFYVSRSCTILANCWGSKHKGKKLCSVERMCVVVFYSSKSSTVSENINRNRDKRDLNN